MKRYIEACFTGIWVQTVEPEDAVTELVQMCRENRFQYYQHDPKDGLQQLLIKDGEEKWEPLTVTRTVGDKPVQVSIKGLDEALSAMLTAVIPARNEAERRNNRAQKQNILLFIWHAHLYGDGLVEDIRRAMNKGESERLHLVFMSHQVKPLELLRPRMAIIHHELPAHEQLMEIAHGLATEEGDIVDDNNFKATIAAAAGMTRIEARNAFSLSLIERNRLDPETVFRLKAQMLKTGNQALVLDTSSEPSGFEDVGGWMAAKRYHLSMLLNKRTPVKARPKGSLLMGVPGGGKDLYINALGKETHRPVLHLHLGRTRGGIQGQTEQWTEEVFRKADRMAPCILAISEIEKLFSGLKSSGLTDGGVKSNQIGAFLNWMQSRTADVYMMASCNDISAITNEMPEFVRAQRFDRIFYVDFPCRAAQDQIWKIHLRAYGHLLPYGIKPKHLMAAEDVAPTTEAIDEAFKQVDLPPYEEVHGRPGWKRWTGAEIEACCAEADLRDIPLVECQPTSMDDIVPEIIAATQNWATGKAYAVEYDGKYQGSDLHAELLEKAFGNRSLKRGSKPSRN
jgi:hypothetical protein